MKPITCSSTPVIERLRHHVALVGLVCLAACGEGGPAAARETAPQTAQTKAALATPTAAAPATAPQLEDPRSGRLRPVPAGAFTARRDPVAYVSECVVDFTNSAALQMSEPSLWFDRLYVPWFQQCGALGFADVRPLVLDHMHLNFADPEVEPCYTHVQAYPARIHDNGVCDYVDVPTEPRTYVQTHLGIEIIRIAAEKANHTERANFDLNQIRIPGLTPVRLCYRKNQTIDGPWIADQDKGSPGIWLCWNQLDPGTWDLSDWVWDVTEVKITATPEFTATFSLDDLHIGIR